jgi:preprotein translocase subunit SecE
MSTEMTDQETEPQRKRGGPMQFLSEVRAEGRKVTWATRQEVTVSTVMVLIMALAASVFFFFVDTLLRLIMGFLLGVGL